MQKTNVNIYEFNDYRHDLYLIEKILAKEKEGIQPSTVYLYCRNPEDGFSPLTTEQLLEAKYITSRTFPNDTVKCVSTLSITDLHDFVVNFRNYRRVSLELDKKNKSLNDELLKIKISAK